MSGEYRAAVTEILGVFDDDPQMTGEVLAAMADGQQTAEGAALARIREIARRVLEGRAPVDDGTVPGMHEHSWVLHAVQGRFPANLTGGPSSGGGYTIVLGRCSSCGEPGTWTLAGAWTLAQVTGDAP